MASQFTCSIQNVLRLAENGNFNGHGRAALYQNRKFTLDADTGKVIRSTSLHARLNNFDASHTPVVLHGDSSYKSITLFKDRSQYAVIQIDTGIENAEKPFFYRTRLDMFLTGTCTEGGN